MQSQKRQRTFTPSSHRYSLDKLEESKELGNLNLIIQGFEKKIADLKRRKIESEQELNSIMYKLTLFVFRDVLTPQIESLTIEIQKNESLLKNYKQRKAELEEICKYKPSKISRPPVIRPEIRRELGIKVKTLIEKTKETKTNPINKPGSFSPLIKTGFHKKAMTEPNSPRYFHEGDNDGFEVNNNEKPITPTKPLRAKKFR